VCIDSFFLLPGQATTRLSRFTKTIGIDPSLPMIQAARKDLEKNTRVLEDTVPATDSEPRISFVHGSAEDLSGILADNSVDMLVSGSSIS
jgi:trans-aconitate 3-methyltransferase